MGEKREGMGLSTAEQARAEGRGGATPVVYETPDYRVVLGKLSEGPQGTAPELLIRYLIQHKKHGIIYRSASGVGQAIGAAIQAQFESNRAYEIAKEQEARGFKLADDNESGASQIPRFQ